jgi:hypothetical protein
MTPNICYRQRESQIKRHGNPESEWLQHALAEDADFEYTMIDGSIVKVHRHGQGSKGGLKARPSDALAAA